MIERSVYKINNCRNRIAFLLALLFLAIVHAAAAEKLSPSPFAFNFDTRTVMLNSGYKMPLNGIGTWALSDKQAEESVYTALMAGARLIDTAHVYGNEAGVGRAVRRSGVPREEIFITTKLWYSDYDNVPKAVDAMLKRLGADYIDLLLLHYPSENDTTAYKGMEQCVRAGKVRSIGVSNFDKADFLRIMHAATITPAVIQNETHPYNQEKTMKAFAADYGTVFESWYPLGGREHTHILFTDPIIAEIAKAHKKSPAQIILRWHLQSGNVVMPGSTNPDHIRENCALYDFDLSNDEMRRIDTLDRQQRFGY